MSPLSMDHYLAKKVELEYGFPDEENHRRKG